MQKVIQGAALILALQTTTGCGIYEQYKRSEAEKAKAAALQKECKQKTQFVTDRLASVHERHEKIQEMALQGTLQSNLSFVKRTDEWTAEAFGQLREIQNKCPKTDYTALVNEMSGKHPYLFETYND